MSPIVNRAWVLGVEGEDTIVCAFVYFRVGDILNLSYGLIDESSIVFAAMLIYWRLVVSGRAS